MNLDQQILDFKKKIADAEKRMLDIVQKASTEKRLRNDEEKAEYTRLKGEIESFKEEIAALEEQVRAAAATVRPVSFEAPGKSDLGKDEIKNVRKLNVSKLVRNAKTPEKLDGVEKELQSVAFDEFRACGITDFNSNAVSIPQLAMRHISWSDEQRAREYRDITSGANLGAELVNTVTDRSKYIEALRPYNVLVGAGIEVLQNASGDNVNYPRENSLYTAAMAATENAAASETMTATLFQTVSFAPKRATAFVQVSNQMLPSGAGQGGSDLEARLRNQIVKGHATLMDTQGISGVGSSGQVAGILNTSGVGTVVGGANGANFSRAFITQFESTAGAAGAVLERCVYITNFSINAFGKRTEFSSGSGRYLVDAAPSWQFFNSPTGMRNISLIDQYPAYLSSNVPNNLTKGTSTALCSAVIFGDPSDAKYMQFGGLQIIVDPYVNAGSALTNYVVHHWFDFRVLRAGSWVISQDMLTP